VTSGAAGAPAGDGRAAGREAWRVGTTVLLVVALGFAVAYRYVGPPPPRRLVLATGAEGGGYHAAGERYAEHVARAGIELERVATAGSLENLEALRSGAADVALVQGGTAPADVADFAKGIASVFLEPLWIFHAADRQVARLSDLAGLRLEVGAEGSGTRAVALELLAANGIGAGGAELSGSAAHEAADRLLAGAVDAVFLVGPPDAAEVARLADREGERVRLLDVERHLAYVRTHPYLAHVVLAEGVLDLERNLPARPVDLVAPTGVLLARADLHPALIPLLIEAAQEVHGAGDALTAPGTFPSTGNLDAPLAPAARRYFAQGPSFLYRVLPFPVAATLDRLKILLLPLLTLLLPLVRVAPPLYRWRIRRKIFRWYAHLERIESRFERSLEPRDASVEALAEVEREIRESVDVPASYMEELHNLRMHLERVRARVSSASAEPADAGGDGARP